MRKSKKLIAMFIIIAILMSNVVLLLSNVSIAAQTNVTVEISADSDSMIKLESDNQTLTYTCDDNSTYSFNLKQGDNNITFTKQTDEIDGRFYDKYVATNISSNEDVFITCPNMNLGKVRLMYNGKSIGMWGQEEKGYWATQFLNQLTDDSDYNHYQIRIESVHNNEEPGDEHEDEHHNDIDWANEIYTVDFGQASWEIKGKTVTAFVEGKDLCSGPVELKGSEIIKLTGYDKKIMEPALYLDTQDNDGFNERLLVNDNDETWVINRNRPDFPNDIPLKFVMQRRTGLDNGEDDWKDLSNTNSTAVVNLSSDEEYKDSYQDAIIEINGYPINTEVEIGEKLPATNNAKYLYNAEENDGKVEFTFSTLFIQKYVGTIEINGKVYDVANDLLDYSNRTDWLNHYKHQMVTIQINVDKVDTYNIKLNVTENEGKDQWIGNFLWTDDEKDEYMRDRDGNIMYDEKENPRLSDIYIGHSLLEVVKVVYEIDEKEVTVEGDDLFKDKYIEYNPYGQTASLVVPEGAKCTMKITPEYGYQVTSFGVNGNVIETGDAISEFTFPIHKGNFHLGAQVTEVDNKVDAKSEKVQEGSIKIANNEIDSGSVILTVNDINPEDAKKAKFEETAGEYTINNYLDIDLDKVLYKGTDEDVWSQRIHELNNEATITLKLEDGIDGNDIIIVHNINDGNEYEVIEIESYDLETNTITFKTSSFSNYAIASKGEKEPEEQVEPSQYTVTFNSNGGSIVESKIVNENEKIEEPEQPIKEGFKFEGWFIDSTLTTPFNFETKITDNVTLYAKWTEDINEEEKDETQEYELSSDNLTFTFTDDANHEYEVMLIDILKLSEEEIASLGVSKEQYDEVLNKIKNEVKEYGTLLNVYMIEIGDEIKAYTGKVDLMIKVTNELEKYNTFKFINIDDDNNFAAGDIVTLKVNGKYLIGTLPHLSIYALVGDTIEENEQNENTQNTEQEVTLDNENIDNPKTGDMGIGIWVGLMVVSFIGIVGTAKKTRKRK